MPPPTNHSSTSHQYELLLGVYIVKPLALNHPNHEYLTPHNYDCLQIVVPRGDRPPVSVVHRILRDGQVQAIILAAIVLALYRHAVLGLRDRGMVDVLMYTIGLCLSQVTIRKTSAATVRHGDGSRAACVAFVWTWSLAVYSAIATAWLSAIVYLTIVSKPEWKFINSFDELREAGLTVIVPDWYNDIGDWRTHVRYRIANSRANCAKYRIGI